MRVLVIDNYDSFAYNLVQYVGEVVTGAAWDVGTSGAGKGGEKQQEQGDGDQEREQREQREQAVVVRRNDAVSLDEIDAMAPDAIVVSPGPGTPEDAGISMPLFAERRYPTLGVCLGHQALCAARGASVGRAEAVVHGKPSTVSHDGTGVFAGLDQPLAVGRYHSLAVDRSTIPESLVETARTEGASDVVMAVRAEDAPHVGLQFHPESILTDDGRRLVANFLSIAATRRRVGP